MDHRGDLHPSSSCVTRGNYSASLILNFFAVIGIFLTAMPWVMTDSDMHFYFKKIYFNYLIYYVIDIIEILLLKTLYTHLLNIEA